MIDKTIQSGLSLAPLLLAQLGGVSSTQLGDWLISGAAVMAMGYYGAMLWQSLTRGLRIEPPPSTTYATIANCRASREKIYDRMIVLDKAMDEKNSALRLEIKGDIRGVHSRIDDVLAAVSDVSGQLKTMEKRQ